MTSLQTRVDEGDREMASTEFDLAHSYPDITPEEIHTLVRQAYARLTPAKVHLYLPILVAREVRKTLRRRQRVVPGPEPRHGATPG